MIKKSDPIKILDTLCKENPDIYYRWCHTGSSAFKSKCYDGWGVFPVGTHPLYEHKDKREEFVLLCRKMPEEDKKKIADFFFKAQTKEDLTGFEFYDWYEYRENNKLVFIKIRYEHSDGRKWLTTIYPE